MGKALWTDAPGRRRRRTFASLSLEAAHPAPGTTTVSFAPYARGLPGLHPTDLLRRLRDADHAGSRRGRTAPRQARPAR
jgi:hypothetical protein